MPGPIDSIKGAFVKALLNKLVDGDKGSTVLGVAAGAALAANLNWGLIMEGFHSQASAMELGKLAGVVGLAVYGWECRAGPGRPKASRKNADRPGCLNFCPGF